MDKICRGSQIGEAHLRAASPGGMLTPRTTRPGSASPQSYAGGEGGKATFFVHHPAKADKGAAGVSVLASRPCPELSQASFLQTSRSAWALGRAAAAAAAGCPDVTPSSGARSPRSPRSPGSPWSPVTCPARSPGSPPPSALGFGALTLTSPHLHGFGMQPGGLTRGRSEGLLPGVVARQRDDWLTSPRSVAQASFNHSPRRRKLGSPRDSMNAVEVLDARGRRLSEASTTDNPSTNSANSVARVVLRNHTFHTSENWMGTPSGRPDGAAGDQEVSFLATPGCSPRREPRPMRLQSGRITENSENWLRMNGEDSTPCPPVLTNSEDYRVYKGGKRTGIAKENSAMKDRLRMDPSQPAAYRSCRRTDFTGSSPRGAAGMSPRSATSPQALTGSPLSQCTYSPLSPGRNQSCADMAASMSPDAATTAGSPKFIVGGDLVDPQNFGRRAALKCVQHGLRDSEAVKAPALPFTAREHRNSDNMREHLSQGLAHVVHRASVPVIYASTLAGPQVSMSPGMGGSTVPPAMARADAYMHAGLSMVRYVPRAPGAYSPNAVRRPARNEVVSL